MNGLGYIICMAIGYFLCLIFERGESDFAKAIFGEESEPEDSEEPEDYTPLM